MRTHSRVNANGIEFIRCLGKSGKNSKYLCRCHCGKVFEMWDSRYYDLRQKSCGCLQSGSKKKYKRLYSIWTNMKTRCNNPHTPEYRRYGGRGVKICSEWENDFPAFLSWSMKNGYKSNLSIDRINNDEGYSPSNCRWADNFTQQSNKSNNVKINSTHGEITAKQWCRENGVNYKSFMTNHYRNPNIDINNIAEGYINHFIEKTEGKL